VISTVVAGIGLVRNDVAVIIGAMVIAPLLGPNMALALATALGDRELIRRSLLANLIGCVAAFALSMVLGLVFTVDAELPAIASRTEISMQHVLLALAAGCAGALALTRGAPAALVGVMVAVALLPPLAACGMLIGSGQTKLAWGAGLLVLVNVISVNLTGVLTFVVQGIRPRSWWEAKKAKRATWTAIGLWTALLATMIAVIAIAEGN